MIYNHGVSKNDKFLRQCKKSTIQIYDKKLG